MRRIRSRVQMVSQNPIASLNPRRRIGDIIAEPLVIAAVRGRAEQLCEIAGAVELFRRPMHPYTATLLAAIPLPDPDAPRAVSVPGGEPPSALPPPSGCRFRTRCPSADARCEREVPAMRVVHAGHQVACHHPM